MTFSTRRVAAAAMIGSLAIIPSALIFLPAGKRTRRAASFLWGAWIGSQFTGKEAPWDWSAVIAFEGRDSAGKPLSVVQWSSPFSSSSCGGNCNFDTSTFQSVRSHNVIPFFSWANTGIADRDIAAGKYDSYISAWAQTAKAWGHPFFLRYDWEMNDSSFSWAVGHGATRNSPAEYVAAWRHVHNIFVANGATNVTWVWCPNVASSGTSSYNNIRASYPGNAYVDWTCLDGYNGNSPWTSFSRLFGPAYQLITRTIAPSKPMIIGEVASTAVGGSKAHWISDMFTALATEFPKIDGLLWFDQRQSGPGGYSDWPIESSAHSSDAFANGIWRVRTATTIKLR